MTRRELFFGTALLVTLAVSIVAANADAQAVASDGKPTTQTTTTWGALEILGQSVATGTRENLYWNAVQSFSGSAVRTPVIAIRGAKPGPTLCLTAAIHGDELNGVEIVRRVTAAIDPLQLSGTIIGVPIVNLLGFFEGSRYLPDRSDLNRFFPGHARHNSASRMAHGFFEGIVRHCDRLVDLHTGSFKRSNLPQLRADTNRPEVVEFISYFRDIVVVHNARERGRLRDAASAAGIPAVTFELGEPGTLQNAPVRHGVRVLMSLLAHLDMLGSQPLSSAPIRIIRRAKWLRAQHGGILNSLLDLGTEVEAGQRLGKIINPVTNEEAEIRAPYAGLVLGRALNQFVLPGYATFHIGRDAPTPAAVDLVHRHSEEEQE